MSITLKTIADRVAFEEQVYTAFPVLPIHQTSWQPVNRLGRSAINLLSGRPWPEVIGWRMYYGEFDFCLSHWISDLPTDLLCYYLPSHLIFASILLPNKKSYFSDGVADALILPPAHRFDAHEALLEEMDDEICMECFVSSYAACRLAVYQALTAAQRVCVADYLEMFYSEHPDRFGERGIELYLRNISYWRNSSLPPC